MPRGHDVIVIGLGTMGAASAHRLAESGLAVLGLDAHRPPHTAGSHHGASRIIRTAYYEHPGYVPLLRRALVLWDALGARAKRDLLVRTGGLMIGPESGELVPGVLSSARTYGLAHELLSAVALARRYPVFKPDPEMVAVWERDAGVLRPEACIRAMLDAACAGGAELRYDEPVLEWDEAGDHIRVTTSLGRHTARALVLAAGTGLAPGGRPRPSVNGADVHPTSSAGRNLARSLAPHLTIERQVVAHFEPLAAPERFGPADFPIHCFEEADGDFYYGLPDVGGGPKFGRHHAGPVGSLDALEHEVAPEDIATIRSFLARRIPDANGPLASSAVCWYTNTPDQHFVVDRMPARSPVIVASVCSGHGFKFAPVVGEIVAAMVRDERPEFDLRMFSAARLTSGPVEHPR